MSRAVWLDREGQADHSVGLTEREFQWPNANLAVFYHVLWLRLFWLASIVLASSVCRRSWLQDLRRKRQRAAVVVAAVAVVAAAVVVVAADAVVVVAAAVVVVVAAVVAVAAAVMVADAAMATVADMVTAVATMLRPNATGLAPYRSVRNTDVPSNGYRQKNGAVCEGTLHHSLFDSIADDSAYRGNVVDSIRY